MSLAQLCLAVFLILYAIVTFGWLAIPSVVLGIFALAAGILLVLEGSGVFSQKLGR